MCVSICQNKNCSNVKNHCAVGQWTKKCHIIMNITMHTFQRVKRTQTKRNMFCALFYKLIKHSGGHLLTLCEKHSTNTILPYSKSKSYYEVVTCVVTDNLSPCHPTLAESIYAFTVNVGILRIYLNPYNMLKSNFDNNSTAFDNLQCNNYFLTTFKKGFTGNI